MNKANINHSPSPLMGEESKVRVKSPKQPTESPSPLMGEESKPVPVLDTGSEGENDATHRHVIADLIRNPEGWQSGAGEQSQHYHITPLP